MKPGKYKSPNGEIHEVIQVDEENKRVEVDYGTHCHWWEESEYSTWVREDEEEKHEDTGEIVLDYVPEPETISEVTENPIVPEKKKRKRTPVKPPAKKEAKPKKKK